MTIEEQQELFRDMLKQGLRPLLCETEVPLYGTEVPCGEPTIGYDDDMETVLLPKELLSMHPEFIIRVKGDSMTGAGIEAGDKVRVVCDVIPHDGDIVLASIDGSYTLKSYCRDDDGEQWLVPMNDIYSPIKLLDGSNARICGLVKEIVKTAPRVAYRQCMNLIRNAKHKQPAALTWEQVEAAIITVSVMVKNGRQWYAVFRAMVDKKHIDKKDYEGFCRLVERVVPDHEYLPSAEQMQRLAIQSFAKPVVLWDENDAPVKNKPFYDYKRIAERMLELLTPSNL